MTDGILKYGHSSTEILRKATENFAGAGLHGLSNCCTPLELMANDDTDTIIAHASGFFWQHNGHPYLITNWHVASGRNIFTNKLLNDYNYIPNIIVFYITTFEIKEGIVSFWKKLCKITLDDNMIEYISKPPVIDGIEVDIWAFPIADDIVFKRDKNRIGFSGSKGFSCILNEQLGKPIITRPGDDCYILGYPLKNYDGLMPPIWKRGSIASDLIFGIGGKPVFLVDSAVAPSMSGSPIIRKAITLTAHNKDTDTIEEFTTYDLIGVYSGRLMHGDDFPLNIGYGWYKTLIDKFISDLEERISYNTMWNTPTE